MKKFKFVIGILLLSMIFFANQSPASSSDMVLRGKYLVERVAMCADCHSSRNEKGAFNQEKWLEGSLLDFKPINPIPNWASKAPGIAGLPGWDEAAAATLFETALTPENVPLSPPMPAYKMSKEDAIAIVAYLKSLKVEK